MDRKTKVIYTKQEKENLQKDLDIVRQARKTLGGQHGIDGRGFMRAFTFAESFSWPYFPYSVPNCACLSARCTRHGYVMFDTSVTIKDGIIRNVGPTPLLGEKDKSHEDLGLRAEVTTRIIKEIVGQTGNTLFSYTRTPRDISDLISMVESKLHLEKDCFTETSHANGITTLFFSEKGNIGRPEDKADIGWYIRLNSKGILDAGFLFKGWDFDAIPHSSGERIAFEQTSMHEVLVMICALLDKLNTQKEAV